MNPVKIEIYRELRCNVCNQCIDSTGSTPYDKIYSQILRQVNNQIDAQITILIIRQIYN